jgi:collagenase-like PrtC family protease
MLNTESELKMCSRCHSNILLEHFAKNRKGQLYQCCNNCRKNLKPKDYDIDVINDLRSEYINNMIEQLGGDSKAKYIGRLNKQSIDAEGTEYMKSKLTGAERIIEYHKFLMVDNNSYLIVQWRVV